MKKSTVTTAFLLFVGMMLPALPDDFARTVAAGKRTLVGSYGFYSSFSCEPQAVPEGQVGRAPQNGRFEFALEQRQMKVQKCGNISIWVRAVYYVPNPGFRGVDSGSVNYIYNTFSEGHETSNASHYFQLTVR
jgi:hypothetical protein